MEKAAELLENTGLKVIEIANQVGYENQNLPEYLRKLMVLRHWSFGGAGEGTFDCVEEISMQYRCFCVKMEGKIGACDL